uniref:Uncharacterized protein n=1 Tax=Romanomermis culicivorax TaxID=13658 RepID=A0A915IG47_ROMCU
MDETDNLYYYGQIRGLVKDGFCNRFAALTWLLPKRPFAPYESSTRFDRSHFVLGRLLAQHPNQRPKTTNAQNNAHRQFKPSPSFMTGNAQVDASHLAAFQIRSLQTRS